MKTLQQVLSTKPITRIRYNGETFELLERDSQRKKVYTAEQEAFPDFYKATLPEDHDEFQRYINKITSSKYWKRLRGLFNGDVIQVELVPAKQRGGWANQYQVSIPKAIRSMPLLMHELAHSAAGGAARHHWPFAAVYLKLVRHYMGKKAHDALRASFKKHRVRYTPKRKRNITPEQREQLRERAKIARAARKKPQS
jgi:hypothetical protein